MPRSAKSVKREAVDGRSVERAVSLIVEKKKSVRQAAKETGVNRSTVQRHLQKFIASAQEKYTFSCGMDVWKVFNPSQEEMLKEYVCYSANIFSGVSVTQIKTLAYDMAKAYQLRYPSSWDVKKIAGKTWYYHFMAKHGADIPLRKSQLTTHSFDRSSVQGFSQNLQLLLSQHQLEPTRIFSAGDTKIAAVHEAKQVTSREKNYVTLICTISASGASLPPHFIFPRHSVPPKVIDGGPPGSASHANKFGWSSPDIFHKYLRSFAKEVNADSENPALLVVNIRESQLSIKAIELVKRRGILLLVFPPHSSHRMNPLDTSVFGPLKRYLSVVSERFLEVNPREPLSILNIAALVGIAYPLAVTSESIMNGFRTTGICPVNERVFSDDDFLGQPTPEDVLLTVENIPDIEPETENDYQVGLTSDSVATDERSTPERVQNNCKQGKKRESVVTTTPLPRKRSRVERKNSKLVKNRVERELEQEATPSPTTEEENDDNMPYEVQIKSEPSDDDSVDSEDNTSQSDHLCEHDYCSAQNTTAVRPRDEFDNFGEEVAMKLRILETSYAQFNAIDKIRNVLFEAGIGVYNQPKDEKTG